MNKHQVLLCMTIDGSHKQNQFYFLEAPQMLYIGLMI